MPQTKGKAKEKAKPTFTAMGAAEEVLTLAEAAAYLRVPEDLLGRLAASAVVPGRKLGEEWRFLKAALHEWLRAPALASSKEAMLSLAGKWKDDPYLDELVREAYDRRGRPMNENGE